MNAAHGKTLRETMKLLVDNEPLVNYPLHDVRGGPVTFLDISGIGPA